MKSEGTSRKSQDLMPMRAAMQLAKQLKILLRTNDITVAQLARKADVSAKTIYNWLAGQKPKDISAVKKVADHFNVTLDFICYGIEKQNEFNSVEEHLDEIRAGQFEVILRRPKKG